MRDDGRFRNREDAARQLALPLRALHLEHPLVLGIPRGGAVLAAVVARELGGEFDVVLSRKLRAPWQPELAVGAVGEDGQVYLDAAVAASAGADRAYVEQERQRQVAEIERRRSLFRAVRPQVSEEGRCVIVTDDGIATGSTMEAALHVVRARGARKVIVAVPVAPPLQVQRFAPLCDRIVCLLQPELFWAIGQFYQDFSEVSDQRVVSLLRDQGATVPGATVHGAAPWAVP